MAIKIWKLLVSKLFNLFWDLYSPLIVSAVGNLSCSYFNFADPPPPLGINKLSFFENNHPVIPSVMEEPKWKRVLNDLGPPPARKEDHGPPAKKQRQDSKGRS